MSNFFGSSEKRPAKWGLVLSGGGTKGAYEVGVWRAIRELKIPIRGIAGTSIGALNAAMFLCCDMKHIESIYKNIKLADVLPVSAGIDPTKNVFDPSNLMAITMDFFRQRGLDNTPLRRMLEMHLDIQKIYASPLDLGIVTYDVPTRVAFQLFKEDIEPEKLIEYLLASANFPIYKTQNIDGKHFLDGGLYDNMPFNPLIGRGYTHLIVVDINGMGQTRKMENSDKVYLNMITCSEDLGGTFEFNPGRIRHNMALGYLDTLKAFHRLFGNYFFFRRPAFNDLLTRFDLETIRGLEKAGKLFGMDRMRIYHAEDFLTELENRYTEAEKNYLAKYGSLSRKPGVTRLRKLLTTEEGLSAAVQFFTEQPAIHTTPFTKAFPDLRDAAKAVIALKNYRKL